MTGIIIAVILILFIAVLLRSRYEVKHFRIKRYTILSDKAKGNMNFGFFSDLHNCLYGMDNKSLLEAVKKEKLDFLISGGDVIVGKRELKGMEPESFYGFGTAFMAEVSGICPTYYVHGNHETRLKGIRGKNPVYNAYNRAMAGSGAININNRQKKLKGNVTLTGVEIPIQAYKALECDRVERLLKGFSLDKQCYNILCVHTPEYFDLYARQGYDLVLCGHNHGGTVRFPWLRGLVSRGFELFPKYSYGFYEKDGTKMLLTGGLGDHTIHFRLFNMPEIVVICLKGKE